MAFPNPLSAADRLLGAADVALRTVFTLPASRRPSPAASIASPPELSSSERKLSGALVRVDHVGEICAQALYTAQALATSDPELRAQLEEAADEEIDHLSWTRARLQELDARPSVLNPLWYAGAFGIGLLAGALGKRTSLAFVAETERQVEAHLQGHLERLPNADAPSRAILAQMREDEARHGAAASAAGGGDLPAPARLLMQAAARVMTATARYV